MALLLAVLVDDRKLEGIRPVKIKKRCNLSTEELFRNQRGSSSGPNFFSRKSKFKGSGTTFSTTT